MNTTEKVLEVLFKNPSKEFHIRLMARITKLNPNTVINVTDKLAKEGLILKYKNRENNLKIIKANTENKTYKLKKQFHNINKLYKCGLIDYLNKTLMFPTIILFGSYAKAEDIEKSDIDLFIITDNKKELLIKNFEESLKKEIQTFIHTKEDFTKLKKTNPELINNVINGYKLEGYLEVL